MASINDITGDMMVSKAPTADYRNNYESIFGQKAPPSYEYNNNGEWIDCEYAGKGLDGKVKINYTDSTGTKIELLVEFTEVRKKK